MKKYIRLLLIFLVSVLTFTSCSIFDLGSEKTNEADKVFQARNEDAVVRIVSGSENKVLEPLIEEFAKNNKVSIHIDYMGSLDIMRLLQADEVPYDAVWPASSLWVSVGDEQHRVKHLESTSTTPVIFGIRDSLAKELGWDKKEVYVKDILSAIEADQLKFTMTSATQSNSGASAYIGFIYALLGSPEQFSEDDLQKPEFQEQLKSLLAGVERSSGSSDWLKDLYLQGDYDAMVNYEALVIDANRILEGEGKETMYAVYPVDGMMMANSPLGFVSANGQEKRDEKKQEEAFLTFQEYLLSDDTQQKIQKTGRRTGIGEVDAANKDVFREEWGIDTQKVISTINMPKQSVLFEALNMYQREFKKPGVNIYLLDFSGSMSGDGERQLKEALGEIMIDEKAKANFLQASDDEINIFIPFSHDVIDLFEATGSKDLEKLYESIKKTRVGGDTYMYEAISHALQKLETMNLDKHSASIIVMTDGMPNGSQDFNDLSEYYKSTGIDIPIFTILFGSASESEMDQIAELTRARVFDGRKNLADAFRSVRGYN